jgi:hypothetical protein
LAVVGMLLTPWPYGVVPFNQFVQAPTIRR